MLVRARVVHGPDRVITGEINDEQLKRISDLAGQDPAFHEILHGPAGYKSPYRTIEQITQDRKSGAIAPSHGIDGNGLFDVLVDDPPTAPTAGKDMLALGRSLHPDFEKDMPASVRDAFEQGRIKTIFRTNSTTVPLGSALRAGRTIDPKELSIYAVDDKGAIARFGKGGEGWTGGPRMTDTKEKTTDATAFAEEVRYTDVGGRNKEYLRDRSGLSTEIGIGKRPVEFDGRGRVHEGTGITDFYHSSGEAEVGGAVLGLPGKSSTTVHKVKDFETEIKVKDGRPIIDLVETSTGTRADAPAAKPKAVIETTPNGRLRIGVGKPVEPKVEKDKPKAVIETTPSGRPTIKVGKPVKAKDAVDSKEASGSTDVISEVIKDVKDIAESEGTLGEALTEKAKEKAKDKFHPAKKIEESISKRVESITDELLDTVMGSSNVERAKRLASADPSPVSTKATAMLTRLTNASGKAPGSADTFLGRGAREAIDVISKPGVTRELLESGGDIARAIAGGTKNSKNLRLAGAATLLTAAGYGIGKLKDHKSSPNKERLQPSPDYDAALRQSLLNDG
jgi:hypothetical protein